MPTKEDLGHRKRKKYDRKDVFIEVFISGFKLKFVNEDKILRIKSTFEKRKKRFMNKVAADKLDLGEWTGWMKPVS